MKLRIKKIFYLRKYDFFTRLRIGKLTIYFTTEHTILHKDHGRPLRRRLRQIRKRMYGELDGCCQICGQHFEASSMTLHHIKPKWRHPELVEEPTNLMLLCRPCHIGLHAAEADIRVLHGHLREHLRQKTKTPSTKD